MLADPAELSGVLNKALEAIAAIRSRGLSESTSTRRAMDEFRKATDPPAVWLDRHTVLRPDAVIPQDRRYQESTPAAASTPDGPRSARPPSAAR
jgi:phage/plasmid-associated DNA primase